MAVLYLGKLLKSWSAKCVCKDKLQRTSSGRTVRTSSKKCMVDIELPNLEQRFTFNF